MLVPLHVYIYKSRIRHKGTLTGLRNVTRFKLLLISTFL